MKISYSILKEYYKVSLEPKKLAELLTNHGIKVESLEQSGNDAVFELEITANRPDCLSFIGIAREVALLTRAKSIEHRVKTSKLYTLRSKPFIQIKDTKLCPIYIGRIIRDIKVAPSPNWLRAHLESIGLRSINNIVDITNFVMMETGQPLHAFDLDKLTDKQIIVRTASKGEKITAIDGKIYELSPETLVIADIEKPVAIAGIMGGKQTEVIESTKNILLESACFDGAVIRRASRKLKLSSDSSYRFERGVNPNGVETASQRAIELILKLAGGKLTDYQALNYLKHKEHKVSLRLERISIILGITIPLPEIKLILKGLGFTILSAQTNNTLRLLVPSFRPDINQEIDIIEELARVWGYDKIPTVAPSIQLQTSQEDKTAETTKITRGLLVKLGYNEVLTNSFWDKDKCAGVNEANIIGVLNPDGNVDRLLRTNLIKGILDTFHLNENYDASQKAIKLFEISKVYKKPNDEKYHLGILDTNGFYAVKGIISDLSGKIGLDVSFTRAENNNSIMLPDVPIENITLINLNNITTGYLGNIYDEKIDKTIAIAELDFEAIRQKANLSKQYKSFSRLPEVKRDLAIVIPENTKWEDVEKVSRQAINTSSKDVPIEKLEFFDLYRGKQVPDGHKSIAFSLSFRHPTKTLSNTDVDEVVKVVVDALNKNLQASLRA
ncbi:MAG: phenylalanine--tRNA ligase subunit beta [Planctomycetota bacterium]